MKVTEIKTQLGTKEIKLDKKTVVKVRNYLAYEEYLSAVQSIVKSMTEVKDGEFEYNPAIRPMVEAYVVFKYFTDIEIEDVSLLEAFKLSQTDWYATIFEEVAILPVWAEIAKAVDAEIAYRTDGLVRISNIIGNLTGENLEANIAKVGELIDKSNEFDPKKYVQAAVDKVVAVSNAEDKKS